MYVASSVSLAVEDKEASVPAKEGCGAASTTDLSPQHADHRGRYAHLWDVGVSRGGPAGFEILAIQAASGEQEPSLAPASSPQQHGYLARRILDPAFPNSKPARDWQTVRLSGGYSGDGDDDDDGGDGGEVEMTTPGGPFPRMQ